MIPANAVDLARLRKLLDVAEEHINTTQVGIYFSDDGNYVSLSVQIKNAPESQNIMRLQPETLLISED